MPINLTNISSGYNLSLINSNFQKIEEVLNGNVLWRTGFTPGETLMTRDLDMNSNDILNAYVNGESLDELVTDVKDVLSLFKALQDLAKQLAYGASRVIGIPSMQVLRLTGAKAPSEIVFLQNYYAGVNGGDGFFYYDASDVSSADNGGTVIVNHLNQRWKRLGTGGVQGAWFGLRGDGVNCGPSLTNALAFIKKHGGTLEFPEGEINLGTTRFRVDWEPGLKDFCLKGNVKGSKLTFDNIDPPFPRTPGNTWESEPSLFVFTADSVDYDVGNLPSIVVDGLHIDYSRQRNKGGNTLETLGQTSPAPYSDGCYGLYIARSLRPVVKNCVFSNIYGDGVIFKRCADFEARNNSFYDVSANQLIRESDGNTAVDHRGGAIFSWSSTGTIDNNFVHNTRTYNVDYTVNGVNVNGTLCGYLGIWSEYSMNNPFGTPSRFAAPLYPWYRNSSSSVYSPVNPDSMVVMTNNRIYGYVIGMKAEAAGDVAMIGNRIFNCYIGIDSVSCSTTIENNWIDQIPTNTCPQSGLRFYQACILLSDFGTVQTAGMMAVVRNNRIFTNTLSPFGLYRNDAVIDSNQIRISGNSSMWKQVDSKTLRNIKVMNNIFRVTRDSYTQTVTASMTRFYQFTLSGNRFINETAFSIGLVFNGFTSGATVTENNHFDGPLFLQVAGRSTHRGNRFENTARLITGSSGSDFGPTVIENNHFEGLTSMSSARISLGTGDVRVRNNTFNLTFDSSKTITGLISATGQLYNVEVEGNKVIENAATENFALINSGTLHNLTFRNNLGSGGRGYFLGAPCFGPFTVEGNIGFGNGIATGNSTDPNQVANLSPTYTPSIGSKVYYMRPVAGGAEGNVFTTTGWKTFGSISS